MCPHFWHFMHRIGSFLSFATFTRFWHITSPLAMALLAACGVLKEMIACPITCVGDLLLGCLAHRNPAIEFGCSLLASSISRMSCPLSGRTPVNGTKYATVLYVTHHSRQREGFRNICEVASPFTFATRAEELPSSSIPPLAIFAALTKRSAPLIPTSLRAELAVSTIPARLVFRDLTFFSCSVKSISTCLVRRVHCRASRYDLTLSATFDVLSAKVVEVSVILLSDVGELLCNLVSYSSCDRI